MHIEEDELAELHDESGDVEVPSSGPESEPQDNNNNNDDQDGSNGNDPAPDTPPADPPEVPGEPGEEGEEGEPGSTQEGIEGLENMSGIERYLSRHDIEGGMIKFDDGSSQHFTELDAGKQEEILSQLHGTVARTVEEKFGLNDSEVGLINHLRESKMSFEEYVSSRVSEMGGVVADRTPNVDDMDAEDVYRMFLQANKKEGAEELSTDALDAEVAKAKELSTFDSVVNGMRTQLAAQNKLAETQETAKAHASVQAQVAEDRATVLAAVDPIKNIAGVELTNNLKNGVLDKVLEVSDDGDSLFQDEVFSDPEKLFRAAFWYYNGDKMMKQRDEYWKREKSSAYKRGRDDVLGRESTPISFTDTSKKKSAGNIDNEVTDWEALHDE